MPNRFCMSHIGGEYDSNRLDCHELSVGGNRVECPYAEEQVQLRDLEGNSQLYIPAQNIQVLPACFDFVPTQEAKSRLIQKLSNPTTVISSIILIFISSSLLNHFSLIE